MEEYAPPHREVNLWTQETEEMQKKWHSEGKEKSQGKSCAPGVGNHHHVPVIGWVVSLQKLYVDVILTTWSSECDCT